MESEEPRPIAAQLADSCFGSEGAEAGVADPAFSSIVMKPKASCMIPFGYCILHYDSRRKRTRSSNRLTDALGTDIFAASTEVTLC